MLTDLFTVEEIGIMTHIGFHWVEKDREWFNDDSTFFTGHCTLYRNGDKFQALFTFHDEAGQYTEEFENFETVRDFMGYIT